MLEILSFGPEAFEHSVEDVPSCESTLSAFAAHKPSARASNGSSCVILEGKLASPEAVFKADVLEIAQTLKLSGWDKLPRKRSSTIHIEKLSGGSCRRNG
jgi:Choline kinase N terminus